MPSKQQPSIFQGGTPKFIKRRQDYTNIQRPKASLSPTNIGNNFNSFNSFKVYGTNENNNNGSAQRKNQQMNQRNESFVVSTPSKKRKARRPGGSECNTPSIQSTERHQRGHIRPIGVSEWLHIFP